MRGKYIDLTGQKFGKLTVIKRSYPNGKNLRTMWLCKCECGGEAIINGQHIRDGIAKSCGCLRKEKFIVNHRKYPLGFGNMRRIIRGYKLGAKKRGYEWELTEKQFKEITQKDCFYCGVKPNNKGKSEGSHGDYIYNGIDRIDNNLGYTMDNIVPCCRFCNIAKNNHTLKEFKAWIKNVSKRIL